MNVLICDDLKEQNQQLEDEIKRADVPDIQTTRLNGRALKNQLELLLKGADTVLTGRNDASRTRETAFDKDVDVVVLDNNLAHLPMQGARLTAEAIAGYVRAFSSAPYIVSVNKNPDVDFDLDFLIGDYTTRTDLAINDRHLSNAALWTHKRTDATDGFLPWYWPTLLSAAYNRRQQIAFVRDHLDDNISDALGFTDADYLTLSPHARSLLSQAEDADDGTSPPDGPVGARATFRQIFLASSRSLPSSDDRRILSNRLRKGTDKLKQIVARVVAAEIDLWFRRDVLGPQDVVVDIPHLLMRMPFLLGKEANKLERWNSAVDASAGTPPFGLDTRVFQKHLKGAEFTGSPWQPSQCFWWSRLRDNNQLNKFFATKPPNWADVVFCEDCSEFRAMNPADQPMSPTEFAARLEGAWNRRYVALLDAFHYVPRTRLVQ